MSTRQAGAATTVRIDDRRFAAHLRAALARSGQADAAVLIDLAAPDLHQGAGDPAAVAALRAVGIALLRPESAGEADLALAASLLRDATLTQWTLGGCLLLPRAAGELGLVVAVTADTGFGELRRLGRTPRPDTAAAVDTLFADLSASPQVGRAVLQRGADPVQTYRRPGTERSQIWQGFDRCHASQLLAEARRWAGSGPGDAQCRQSMSAAAVVVPTRSSRWMRVPFRPQLLVGLAAPGVVDLSAAVVALGNDVLRDLIGTLLAAGLKTEIESFPEMASDFEKLLVALRALAPDDLESRLILGGFADHAIGTGLNRMRCAECVYYLAHRRWCDLPELPVPVEPDWFCRLWRM